MQYDQYVNIAYPLCKKVCDKLISNVEEYGMPPLPLAEMQSRIESDADLVELIRFQCKRFDWMKVHACEYGCLNAVNENQSREFSMRYRLIMSLLDSMHAHIGALV